MVRVRVTFNTAHSILFKISDLYYDSIKYKVCLKFAITFTAWCLS